MATDKSNDVFSDAEKKALKDRAAELKRQARHADKREAGLHDLLEKVAEMPPGDRTLAEKIHAIVSKHAPQLDPKTWYSFPAYASDGTVMIFFQPAAKFGARYATLGFTDTARLDNSTFWATTFAVTEITPEIEQRIIELVKRAAD